jgi:hypothetical protein
MMTMKEACRYKVETIADRCKLHRESSAIHGPCKGLTDAEYYKVPTRQRSTFRKGKTHAFTRLWVYHNNRINLNKK